MIGKINTLKWVLENYDIDIDICEETINDLCSYATIEILDIFL